MLKVNSRLMATAVAVTCAIASAAPVAAAPAYFPQAPQTETFHNVQHDWRRRPPNRDYRLMRRGDAYYLNGRRGYRNYRPGYRRYNDWWFPAGAFIAGAIIGDVINRSPPPPPPNGPPGFGDAHAQWCYGRYRSYRASDNSFQPYNGARQQCYSPYS